MGQFRAYLAQKWNEYFANVPFPNRPICAFTVAGLNPVDGTYNKPVIYTMISQFGFAPSLHRYGFACAGIPTFATYILNRRYDRSSSVDTLAGLVAFAISETASQDQRVGGPIKITTIEADGIKELNQDQVQSLLDSY
jgi:20S proteasome alpha/beta subunit